MTSDFAALPEGFSVRSHGRSGFVYFRAHERVLQFYWEISGVEDYDWLLSLEAAKVWAHPKGEMVAEEEQRRIVGLLEAWLASERIRTDAFGPIKRSLFPRR